VAEPLVTGFRLYLSLEMLKAQIDIDKRNAEGNEARIWWQTSLYSLTS